MELEVNQTPVRTSKNFNINNIKLENVSFPSKILEFNNLKILNSDTKVTIDDLTSPIALNYGLGAELTNLVINNSNKKINVNINSKTNKEIQIKFDLDKKNSALLEDIEITANESTKETVIIKYTSDSSTFLFHDGIIRVNAKENSVLNVIIVNLINEKSSNFLAIQNNIDANAKVNYTIVDFGGKNSITNHYTNMTGDSAKTTINTIYLGHNSQVFDLNYIAELRGLQNDVKIEVQGALADTAKKHFKGTIDFKRGCKKSVGDENEACMLLSNTAKSLSLPMLLCSEEDVEGNHSSSAGKIDEKELFYIMTRGFSLKEAMKLLVKAKFNKILETIPNYELREKIIKEIDMRLN